MLADSSVSTIMISIVVSISVSLATIVATHKLAAQTREIHYDKERLQRLYVPLLVHLRVNEELWKSFQKSLAHIGVAADDRKGKDVMQSILDSDDSFRESAIKLWISAMEGVFRKNNESAERVMLENLSFLTEQDSTLGSDLYGACLAYLVHVGEFKSLFHRWEGDSTKVDGSKVTWYSISENKWEYFHPENGYPDELITAVEGSVDSLNRKVKETWVFFS